MKHLLGLIPVILLGVAFWKTRPATQPIRPELAMDVREVGWPSRGVESLPSAQSTEDLPLASQPAPSSDPLVQEAEQRVNENPREALEWAAQLPEKEAVLGDERFRQSIRNMAQALTGMSTAHPGEQNLELQHFLSLWAEVDLSAAQSWATQQPQGDARNEMITRIASIYSETHPAEAACWILDEIPPGPAQEEAVMTVIHHWSLQNRQEVIAWVQQFPPSSLRLRATQELDSIVSSQNSAFYQRLPQ